MMQDAEMAKRWEQRHPGWIDVAGLLGTADPVLGRILLLPGYEFSSNIYAVRGARLSIVDAGNDYTAFADLFAMGFSPADIEKVVLTHGHRDHAMGLFELLRSYRPKAGEQGFELVLHEAAPPALAEAAGRFGLSVLWVRGGEAVEMGGEAWEVLYTPGHTVDGICLFHPQSGAAFTGDTVLPHAVAEPDEAAGGELAAYLGGVRRLLAKGIRHVLPGHGIPAAGVGARIVEESYECLMMRAIGVEAGANVAWADGAAALARKGLFAEALYCCDRALAWDPSSRRALEMKAFCLNDLGRFEEALEAFDAMAKKFSPDAGDPFPIIGRGFALMGLGRYGESVEHFDQALAVRPGMREALVYKGMALYLAGRCAEAMEIEEFQTEFRSRFPREARKRQGGGWGR